MRPRPPPPKAGLGGLFGTGHASAPTFLVHAVKDPRGGNLDRPGDCRVAGRVGHEFGLGSSTKVARDFERALPCVQAQQCDGTAQCLGEAASVLPDPDGGEDGKMTHAALQNSDGTWSSKLGSDPLIRHLTADVFGSTSYGRPVAIYARLA